MAEGDKANDAHQPSPGQVIAPGGAPPMAAKTTPPENPAPAQPPAPPEPPTAPPPVAPQSQETATRPDADGSVSWTASEFIAHDKSGGWYLGLAAVAAVVAAAVYFVTRDYISTLVVLVGAFSLGVLGARKPKQQQYHMTTAGIQVGEKYYDFNSFRSFSVVPEGAFSSIVFMPLKRFAPLLTVYFAPQDEEIIINLLSDRLPFEEHKADAIDSLMRQIRF